MTTVKNLFSVLDPDYETYLTMNKQAEDDISNSFIKKSKYESTTQHQTFIANTITKKNKSPQISYEDKLKIIQDYFGVSKMCAIYLYHRRRRGLPWHNHTDPKYLEWTIQLQNALIHLDSIPTVDWRSLEFGYEEVQLGKHNISMSTMPKKIMVNNHSNKIYYKKNNGSEPDGFIPVKSTKINITSELNRMGLIPRSYCNK